METLTKYEVKEVTWPQTTFISKRVNLALSEVPDFLSSAYQTLYEESGRLGLQTVKPPCAIYYSMDMRNHQTDMAAAIPIEGVVPDLNGFIKITLPQSKALLVEYYGRYEYMSAAYAELEKWLSQNSLERELIIEEYHTDPTRESDSSKWKTNIYYLIK